MPDESEAHGVHCRTIAILAIVVSFLALACAADREVSPPPNVFIVLVDTLRADRVDVSGGEDSLTPFLDSLAATSTVFHNAYSTSAWTSPAVASLFTSRYPSQHGVNEFDAKLLDPELTLAELLRRRGYRSGGFSSNVLIGRSRGFQQGFDDFDVQGAREVDGLEFSERTFETARRALRWIDRLSKPSEGSEEEAPPVFVYLHVLDPHLPYAPDSKALDRVFEGGARPDAKRVNREMQTHLTRQIDEETRHEVRRLYDAEVSSTDAGLEFFFSKLSKRGLLDNSIIVITSDHGEELWDHGMFGHHHSLHEEVLRVPVLIRTPRQLERRDVRDAISLLDIAPTVLEAMGADPVEAFEGRSLVSLMAAESGSALDRAAPVVGELLLDPIFRRTAHERTVIMGDTQLIRTVDGVDHFLPLSTGPEARSPDAISEAEKQALRRGLEAFLDRVAQTSPTNGSARERLEIDEADRKELRALGYVE